MGSKLKILYGIQGTGNGHISRSKEIVNELRNKADVDILISGLLHQMGLGIRVKFNKNGTGAWFSKNGKIDYLGFLRKTKVMGIIKDILFTPVKEYDLIVSDFEPITAWAAKLFKAPSFHISREIALLHDNITKPNGRYFLAEKIIKYYAPCDKWLGFHYHSTFPDILTPIIRSEVRSLDTTDNGHYLINFSCYDPFKIADYLSSVDAEFDVFSGYYHSNRTFKKYNVRIYPFEKERFLRSLSSCSGIICNSGFQLTSEALYLGKKLLVVPMKGQYEQFCNAEELSKFGSTVLPGVELDFGKQISSWIKSSQQSKKIEYPEIIPEVVSRILNCGKN